MIIRHFGLIVFFFSCALSLNAQVEVVLRVDMSEESVSEEGLFVIGSFQEWSIEDQIALNWEGDNVYSATLEMAPGNYEYLFINGLNQPISECEAIESCLDPCFSENNEGEKIRFITVEENVIRQVSAAYIFNSCEETLPASIEELKNNRTLSINPNPMITSTTLAFSNPKNQSFDIILSDLSGKMIRYYNALNGSNVEIQKDDLSKGMYLLTLKTDKGEVANRKLLVY